MITGWNVIDFDFRSLYPSIIRTFNIDPLTHMQAEKPEDHIRNVMCNLRKGRCNDRLVYRKRT